MLASMRTCGACRFLTSVREGGTGKSMTLLAVAGYIEHCQVERVDEIRTDTSITRVTCTFTVGKQSFVVTIEELAKDSDEPAIT